MAEAHECGEIEKARIEEIAKQETQQDANALRARIQLFCRQYRIPIVETISVPDLDYKDMAAERLSAFKPLRKFGVSAEELAKNAEQLCKFAGVVDESRTEKAYNLIPNARIVYDYADRVIALKGQTGNKQFSYENLVRFVLARRMLQTGRKLDRIRENRTILRMPLEEVEAHVENLISETLRHDPRPAYEDVKLFGGSEEPVISEVSVNLPETSSIEGNSEKDDYQLSQPSWINIQPDRSEFEKWPSVGIRNEILSECFNFLDGWKYEMWNRINGEKDGSALEPPSSISCPHWLTFEFDFQEIDRWQSKDIKKEILREAFAYLDNWKQMMQDEFGAGSP